MLMGSRYAVASTSVREWSPLLVGGLGSSGAGTPPPSLPSPGRPAGPACVEMSLLGLITAARMALCLKSLPIKFKWEGK